MARRVLITGFEPFGGETVNPSELVVRSLEGRPIAGRSVAVSVLPVESRTLGQALHEAVQAAAPDILISCGQAGGRNAMALERVAVNVLDFKQPDNTGAMIRNEPILRGGPDARLSPLPFAEIVQAWIAAGVPGYVSNTAGTFCCNQVLYEALGIAESCSPPIAAGFVHLPYLPEQAAARGAESTPSMAPELMKRGMEVLIETVVRWIDRRAPSRAPVRTVKGSHVRSHALQRK